MTRSEILDAARACVCGGRERDHGKPEDNFRTVGALWGVYLRAKYPELGKALPADGVAAQDVAVMMALLKVARIATGRSPDNFVDLAGYAACAGEVAATDNSTGSYV